MATTDTATGFKLPCPMCGDDSGSICINLNDMTDFHCSECDANFMASDVQSFIRRWSAALEWVEAGKSMAREMNQ